MLVDNLTAWSVAQNFTGFIGTDGFFKLDIDCLAMTDENRNTNSSSSKLDFWIKHFFGFGNHFPFFFGVAVFHEYVDMGNNVESNTLGEFTHRNGVCHKNGA